MTSTTLAARIGTLTHSLDALERLHARLQAGGFVNTTRTLGEEIEGLHVLLDTLNADYAALEDRELDHAFEGFAR